MATAALTPTLSLVPMSERRAQKLRNACQKMAEWREKRDEEIRTAHEEGASLREIGNVIGLSHVSVRDILLRPGYEVSHIVPLAEGGRSDDPDNIEVITAEENRRKALKDKHRREQGG